MILAGETDSRVLVKNGAKIQTVRISRRRGTICSLWHSTGEVCVLTVIYRTLFSTAESL
jgi:hypothetical protein